MWYAFNFISIIIIKFLSNLFVLMYFWLNFIAVFNKMWLEIFKLFVIKWVFIKTDCILCNSEKNPEFTSQEAEKQKYCQHSLTSSSTFSYILLWVHDLHLKIFTIYMIMLSVYAIFFEYIEASVFFQWWFGCFTDASLRGGNPLLL